LSYGTAFPHAMVRLKEFGQFKNPMTSSEIEPGTFQIVA
jgi:hypothetical protein